VSEYFVTGFVYKARDRQVIAENTSAARRGIAFCCQFGSSQRPVSQSGEEIEINGSFERGGFLIGGQCIEK
jgi:hypothetical protein